MPINMLHNTIIQHGIVLYSMQLGVREQVILKIEKLTLPFYLPRDWSLNVTQ